MKSGNDTAHVHRHLSRHDTQHTPRSSGMSVAPPARPPVPPLALPTASPATTEEPKEKIKTHRAHTHRATETARSVIPKRPIEQLASDVDAFVMDVSKSNAHDETDEHGKKIIDLERLITIKNSLQLVVREYEKRPEFKIRENMSARKVELDNLIAAADKEYAEKTTAHQTAVEALDVRLDALHQHLTEMQGQTLIEQFKRMEEFQYYNNKIRDEVASINDELDAQSCCSRLFCCCWPSADIVKKQKELQMLRDEQDALDSSDVTRVSEILSSRIEADRQKLIEQREALAQDQPQETAQKLRDERTKLQEDIDADREAYYHTISPPVMLNLVRLQSFMGRMVKKINFAKAAAEARGDTIKTGLLHAVSVIVTTFLDKFNKMCGDYVCRPPQNEDNTISYAQYCDRFHKLKEEEKKLLITGPPAEGDKRYGESVQKIQKLDESIFYEHMAPAPQPESAASSSDSGKALSARK